MRRSAPFRAAAAVLAIAAAAALPSPVHAQDEPVTWGVVPSSTDGPDGRAAFDYKLDPGAELTDHVAISNHSREEITLAVYASDAFTTPDGGFDLLPSDQQPVDVGAWITLDNSTLTIPARSRVDLPFRLSVPANATPGDHVGGMVASLTSAGTGQVRVEHRVGARIYLRVTGELRPQLTIERLEARYTGTLNPFAGGTVTATYLVRNTGNVRLAGQPRLVVTGPFGLGRRSLDAAPLPEILPGDAVTATARLDGVFPLVRLSATVEASGGSGHATVWAVPWSQAVLLLLVAAAVAGWWWLRRRRRRQLTAAREQGRSEALAQVGGGDR